MKYLTAKNFVIATWTVVYPVAHGGSVYACSVITREVIG